MKIFSEWLNENEYPVNLSDAVKQINDLARKIRTEFVYGHGKTPFGPHSNQIMQATEMLENAARLLVHGISYDVQDHPSPYAKIKP